MRLPYPQGFRKSPRSPPDLEDVESDFPRFRDRGAKIGFNCVSPDRISFFQERPCSLLRTSLTA